MGENMRFDDVAYYADRCARQGGRVVELGCGNGRVLLPLLARGLDAVGVDASGPMLRELARKAATRTLPVRAVRADARRLPFRAESASAVLCPYSLVTYMTTSQDLAALLQGARDLLAPRGVLVADAFVPREVTAQPAFTPDYRRPFGALTLARSKRITPLPEGTNRIERRYEIIAAGGRAVETIEVSEVIRPIAPADLRAALSQAGLVPVDEAWDYGTRPGAAGAQFFSVVARKT